MKKLSLPPIQEQGGAVFTYGVLLEHDILFSAPNEVFCLSREYYLFKGGSLFEHDTIQANMVAICNKSLKRRDQIELYI